jgi:LysM repeat protein
LAFIQLPTLAPTPITTDIEYTVKEGDNLYFIADQFNVDINTLAEDNNIEFPPGNIYIGQVLKIRTTNTP